MLKSLGSGLPKFQLLRSLIPIFGQRKQTYLDLEHLVWPTEKCCNEAYDRLREHLTCYKSQAAGPRRFNLRPQFSASGGASNSATPIPLQLVPESHLSSPPTLRCAMYMIQRAAARKLEGPSAVTGPRGRLPSSLPACMV